MPVVAKVVQVNGMARLPPTPAIAGLNLEQTMALLVLRSWARRRRTTAPLRSCVPTAQLDRAIAIAGGERYPQDAEEIEALRAVLAIVIALIRRMPAPRRATGPVRRVYSD
jgi:hypothetical protein